jgi:hypothetical protein
MYWRGFLRAMRRERDRPRALRIRRRKFTFPRCTSPGRAGVAGGARVLAGRNAAAGRRLKTNHGALCPFRELPADMWASYYVR